MIKHMFVVRDSVANIYGAPFFSVNNATAIRDFLTAARDPSSSIGQNPSDYTMYRIGHYDDETGIVTSQEPEFITLATAVLTQE